MVFLLDVFLHKNYILMTVCHGLKVFKKEGKKNLGKMADIDLLLFYSLDLF